MALHLGHRHSVDFDWFGRDFLDDPMSFAHDLMSRGVELQIRNVQRRTLHAVISEIRTGFFDVDYTMLQSLETIVGMGVRIASMRDLSAMKLLSVAQRGTRKDFIDVAALLDRFSLVDMLDDFRRKYTVSDTGGRVYRLTYFDDVEMDPMPEMLSQKSWPAAKQTIRDALKALAGEL